LRKIITIRDTEHYVCFKEKTKISFKNSVKSLILKNNPSKKNSAKKSATTKRCCKNHTKLKA